MEQMKQAGQIDATPPSLYAIWAAGTPDGPLAGQSGYLAEDGRRLYFHERETAEQKIRDLQNRCVSGSPAAAYQCLAYPGEGLPDRSITAEDCQRQFEIVRKRRRNFVVFRRGGG